jgi:hypothetical protein
MSESRRIYERQQIYLTRRQKAFVVRKAKERDPERTSPKRGARFQTVVHRDAIDFAMTFEYLFDSFVAIRALAEEHPL